MPFFCLAKVVLLLYLRLLLTRLWQLQINSLLLLSFLLNSLLLLLKTFNFLLFWQILLTFSINLLWIFARKFFFWQSSNLDISAFMRGVGEALAKGRADYLKREQRNTGNCLKGTKEQWLPLKSS